MKFYLRTILGILILVASSALFLYGLYILVRGGTCASGGPYVSSKQCAAGTTTWMLILPATVMAALVGGFLVSRRGPRPGAAPAATTPITVRVPRMPTDWAALLGGEPVGGVHLFSAPESGPSDPVAQLEKLQALLNAGVLTPDEFQLAKTKILADM